MVIKYRADMVRDDMIGTFVPVAVYECRQDTLAITKSALEYLAEKLRGCPWDESRWTPEGGCGEDGVCDKRGDDKCWIEYAIGKAKEAYIPKTDKQKANKEDDRLECIDCENKIDPEDLSSDVMCPSCLHELKRWQKRQPVESHTPQKQEGKK